MQQAYFSEMTILSALDTDVDELNDVCIAKLSHVPKTFLSIDTAINDSRYQDHSVSKEYLHIINLSGLPRHLLRNLDPIAALCNGTRLIAVAFGE